MTSPPVSVAQLVDKLGIPHDQVVGSPSTAVRSPGTTEGVVPGGFTFCKWEGDRAIAAIKASPAAVLVVPSSADASWFRADQTAILTDTPRRTFVRALPFVVDNEPSAHGVHSTAVVDPSAVISPTASIGAHCVVGPRSSIGPETVLHPHVIVGRDVTIGRNTTVFSGTVIGADGFGYEHDDDGSVLKFMHVGGVVIGDNVEIGANTCVDRGTLGNTTIDDEARVDNLVHVAHNVHIGKRAFVIALTMIGGSTVIENDAWVAPGSVLRNGIVIGQRSTVGLGAVVTRSVEPDAVVLGNPARPREPKA